MDREETSCLCTLWLIIAINGLIIIPQIIGGNLYLLLFLILVIIGAAALTIHYSRDNSSVRKYKKDIRYQLSAKKYEKEKYVICPECKHLVEKESKLCKNCGNQV